tara:strand:+ start:7565 stop:7747 length:183 start_codon:yes stop_codon:yes gene_type:complete
MFGVGEHSHGCEVSPQGRDGAMRRENVGMSNRNSSENDEHRKPKVSLVMTINQGLGGPNL